MALESKDDVITKILEEAELVSASEIKNILRQSKESGQSVRQLLIQSGAVKEEDMLAAIAQKMGMEVVDLDNVLISPEALKLVPEKIAKKYHIFPIRIVDNILYIAVSDPFDLRIFDDLKMLFDYEIKGVIAKPEQIEKAIKRYYEKDTVEKMMEDITEKILDEHERTAVSKTQEAQEDKLVTAKITEYDLDKERAEASKAPVVKLVELLFRQALHDRASDIHIEPYAKGVRVRFRIDGILHDIESPPKKWQNAIISRIKILSKVDLAEKRLPQDGRIQLKIENRSIDVRVSILPSLYGESIVMRLLDQSSLLLGLEQVGFLPDNIKLFYDLIRRPYGIMLLTGPTGSGKTTTLYAALSAINTVDKKLVTVEDPVEYQITGINQVQVNPDIGLTFAKALRHILRQAPDVILVGEIRDLETAEIAIRAALTGHLVFSTLHTNDAPSATVRLVDMGIRPFMVASSIQAVVAQRLVRVICSSCKESYTPNKVELEIIKPMLSEGETPVLYKGKGCSKCNYLGYRGRTAIHEIMVMNDTLRQMVLDRASAAAMKKKAREFGMRTLREDGIKKALMGITTLEEVLSITQMDVA